MTLSDRQKIFTLNIAKLIEFAYENKFELTFGEVYRTIEQQKIYFDSGRSKTMNSKHLQRLAVDFNIFYNGTLLFQYQDKYIGEYENAKVLGDYWMSLHESNVWGADWDRNPATIDKFHDPYHFEMQDK